jgi:hypothetical protein
LSVPRETERNTTAGNMLVEAVHTHHCIKQTTEQVLVCLEVIVESLVNFLSLAYILDCARVCIGPVMEGLSARVPLGIKICRNQKFLESGQLDMFIMHQNTEPSTYDHRSERTRGPVRSPIFKLRIGRSVVRWVTTCESLLLYVFFYLSIVVTVKGLFFLYTYCTLLD